MSAENADTTTLVAQSLKQLAPRRYYASLMLPEAQRAHIQTIWAFSAEIAATRHRVSEPAPGEIRLQYWVDLLEGKGHGDTARNPLAIALQNTIKIYALPTGALVRLVAARRFDLYQDPMPDMETFQGYAGETVSILFQTAAAILDGGTFPKNGDAAGHLGVAECLIGNMLAFAHNASEGRIFLPMSLFISFGVTDKNILGGTRSPELTNAWQALIAQADEHLAMAKQAISDQPRPLRPAFATVALLHGDLKRLKLMQTNPFGPTRAPAAWQDIGRLMLFAPR